MTIQQALTQATTLFAEHQIPDPDTDALLLLSCVTGLSLMETRLQKTRLLSTEQEQRFTSLLLSRTKRIPLQYLLQEQWFYGRRFQVDKRVLIPRQETETLCSLALDEIRGKDNPTVLDLCTGSGAIAVTMQAEYPAAKVYACDLSHDALQVAKSNALLNGTDITFFQGDLFSAIPEGIVFDMILSNPPYIPTESCLSLQPEVMQEPNMALDGGADGLDFYRRIAAEAPKRLRSQGCLMVEIGFDQGVSVPQLFADAGFVDVKLHKDLYGEHRVVSGKMP